MPKFKPQCMHPADAECNERCKALPTWPSLSETQQKTKRGGKKGKKRSGFARDYTATEVEVKLQNPDHLPHILLATFTVGN